ncbi:hypothetical protein F5Y16DRAFT_179657 [Xylariaceae sp. FL0255]|nr:hypothetical protein F5Y16DRAFT_179657 [Xylariaceae sp. FL0255]
MADTQKPVKKGLPFKRTVKKNPLPTTDSDTLSVDDSGLSLFSRSKDYFVEDQQRRAREKVAKAEQERKEKLAQEEKERQEKLEKEERENTKALEAQFRREEQDNDSDQARETKVLKQKRPHDALSSSDDEDDIFAERRSSKSQKPSTPRSSRKKNRNSPLLRDSRTPGSARARRPAKEITITLSDDSDDDDSKSRRPRDSATPLKSITKFKDVSSTDSDLEIMEEVGRKQGGGEEEDFVEQYVKAAMERMQKSKEARLAAAVAAESNNGNLPSRSPDVDDRGPTVSVMIAPPPKMPEANPLCCTVRTDQALEIAFSTFKERLKTQTKYPHEAISELLITWRGDRVFDTTKLSTLGICPRGGDGRLYDSSFSSQKPPEGYMGRDKVFFEAWSPDEYDAMQERRERDRERKIESGEYDLDGPEDRSNSQKSNEVAESQENKVRVTFKARDMPPSKVTLRKCSTVAHMIMAFRKLSRIGEDKHVEIRWDGEVLDHETTVEEADIGDMDSVEVHVR